MIAWRPFSGVVGNTNAIRVKLPGKTKARCGGTTANEPIGIDWKRPGWLPLQGAPTRSGANGVASGPASGCFSRTISASYRSQPMQLTMKRTVSPGATLHRSP
jgi:hypothetical protein